MMCPYLLISINELLISIIPFIDINKYGLNVKTAAHTITPLVLNGHRKYIRAVQRCAAVGTTNRLHEPNIKDT